MFKRREPNLGLELFQYTDPPHERREDTMEYWKNGFFHIAITHADVEAKVAEIVDTGSNAPGTILGRCSEEFRRLYDTAELVIAKGQANYETLSNE